MGGNGKTSSDVCLHWSILTSTLWPISTLHSFRIEVKLSSIPMNIAVVKWKGKIDDLETKGTKFLQKSHQ